MWFLLNAYKKREERDKLRNKLLSRKESEFEDLKYSQPNHIAKNEKVTLKRTAKVWLDNL